VVTVTFHNDGAADVYLLRWQTPLAGISGNLFDVRRGGESVPYIGAYYKFAAPGPEDYVRIAAGESRAVKVDLSRVYDFSRAGEYTVQYWVALQDALRDATPVAIAGFSRLASNVASIGVDRDDSLARFRDNLRPVPGKAASSSFVKCSASQQSDLITARGNAHTITADSINYLNGHTANNAGPRYTTWFGAITSSRYTTVSGQYPLIDGVFTSQPITFDCGCHQKKTYAYVYPDREYEIHLCGAFWTAPAMGTDSKAGTLVHETSHFTVVAGTNDYAYGQSACRKLAQKQPRKAIANADSHEYYAEAGM